MSKLKMRMWVLASTLSFAALSAHAELVVIVNPKNASALNYLGYMLADRNVRLQEAHDFIRRALDEDPNNGAYLDSLGWAHFKKGELNEAMKYLSAAAAKLPSNSEVQDHLGDVHARRGSLQEAIAAWTKALAGDGQGIEKAAVERKLEEAKRKLPR